MNQVTKIVLSGGPCGGKTTVLSHIREKFSSLGFTVYIVPETPTLLLMAGVSNKTLDFNDNVAFQTAIIRIQMALEAEFLRLAEAQDKPVLIVFDRGLMDGRAFCTDAEWTTVLSNIGTVTPMLRDKGYDAVIHLETAAAGAPDGYTLENNPARKETAQQAIEADRRIRSAWTGCPKLKIIKSNPDFNAKIRAVLKVVSNIVGVPAPMEIERKFLVLNKPTEKFECEEISICQTYLVPSSIDIEERVRKRSQSGVDIFFRTIKREQRDGQCVEEERKISGREYYNLLLRRDCDAGEIRKIRKCFLWGGHYFELDEYIFPKVDFLILEVELESIDEEFKLPPFISIDKEVTGNDSYSNYGISRL